MVSDMAAFWKMWINLMRSSFVKPPRHSCSLVDGLEVPALSVKTWMILRCFPISLGMSQEILVAYRFLMMVI